MVESCATSPQRPVGYRTYFYVTSISHSHCPACASQSPCQPQCVRSFECLLTQELTKIKLGRLQLRHRRHLPQSNQLSCLTHCRITLTTANSHYGTILHIGGHPLHLVHITVQLYTVMAIASPAAVAHTLLVRLNGPTHRHARHRANSRAQVRSTRGAWYDRPGVVVNGRAGGVVRLTSSKARSRRCRPTFRIACNTNGRQHKKT